MDSCALRALYGAPPFYENSVKAWFLNRFQKVTWAAKAPGSLHESMQKGVVNSLYAPAHEIFIEFH